MKHENDSNKVTGAFTIFPSYQNIADHNINKKNEKKGRMRKEKECKKRYKERKEKKMEVEGKGDRK